MLNYFDDKDESFPINKHKTKINSVYLIVTEMKEIGKSSPAEQAARDVRGEVRREVWERWHSHLFTEDQIRGYRAVRAGEGENIPPLQGFAPKDGPTPS